MTFFSKSILQVRAIFECGNQVLEHGIVFNDIASLFLAQIVSKSATLIAPGTLQLKILNGHWAVGQLRSSDLQPLAFHWQVESNGSLPSQSRRMKGRSESRFFPPLSPCGVAKVRRPIATFMFLKFHFSGHKCMIHIFHDTSKILPPPIIRKFLGTCNNGEFGSASRNLAYFEICILKIWGLS